MSFSTGASNFMSSDNFLKQKIAKLAQPGGSTYFFQYQCFLKTKGQSSIGIPCTGNTRLAASMQRQKGHVMDACKWLHLHEALGD